MQDLQARLVQGVLATTLIAATDVFSTARAEVPPVETGDSAHTSLPGPGFSLVLGETGQLGCLPRTASQDALTEMMTRVNAELGIDPAFSVTLSLPVPTCTDIYYVAVANDVEGIGYENVFDSATFDNVPETRLEGIVYLNDAPYWETRSEELTRAFLHEVGHRWGARVAVSGEDPWILLGRDREHWSYFLDTKVGDTGVSPLEGNAWQTTADGVESTVTHARVPTYSPLDLYLMGVLPPDQVTPLDLLQPGETPAAMDCRGAVTNEASPPQRCEPASLEAERATFTIEDVIEAEGERIPAAVDTSDDPLSIEISFALLTPDDFPLEAARCELWTAEIARLISEFERATEGRAVLVNVSPLGHDCEGLQKITAPAPSARAAGGGGCSVAPSPRPASVSWMILGAAGLLLAFLRRSTQQVVGGCRKIR